MNEKAHDEETGLIVELAKNFMELMFELEPDWERAYFRLVAQRNTYGANGSYMTSSEAKMIHPVQEEDKELFGEMMSQANDIIQLQGKEDAVLLLMINSDFDYEVKFEYENLDRWKINFLDGKNGVPEGL